jgi:hypothetical protein
MTRNPGCFEFRDSFTLGLGTHHVGVVKRDDGSLAKLHVFQTFPSTSTVVVLFTSPNEYSPIIHGRVMYHSFNPVMHARRTLMAHLTVEECNHVAGFAVVLISLNYASISLVR